MSRFKSVLRPLALALGFTASIAILGQGPFSAQAAE